MWEPKAHLPALFPRPKAAAARREAAAPADSTPGRPLPCWQHRLLHQIGSPCGAQSRKQGNQGGRSARSLHVHNSPSKSASHLWMLVKLSLVAGLAVRNYRGCDSVSLFTVSWLSHPQWYLHEPRCGRKLPSPTICLVNKKGAPSQTNTARSDCSPGLPSKQAYERFLAIGSTASSTRDNVLPRLICRPARWQRSLAQIDRPSQRRSRQNSCRPALEPPSASKTPSLTALANSPFHWRFCFVSAQVQALYAI